MLQIEALRGFFLSPRALDENAEIYYNINSNPICTFKGGD